MTTPTYPLSKLQHQFDQHVVDKDSGLEVFHATSAHSLIQAAGYLKHTRARNAKKGVFFRGQVRLYPSLGPTLLRGVRGAGAPQNTTNKDLLRAFLAKLDADKKALRAVDENCREALLQHYGIRTTWLDVVDNIWVALWFACHQAKSLARGDEEYLHFEKRVPRLQASGDPQYAYVLLLESASFEPVAGLPGHYRDDRSETIDLRVAAPSHFIRPHAQHGLLVRRLSNSGSPVGDCRPLHVGTIRVDLADALDWLGSASTLTIHSLFPPAYYDYGYRELLEFVQPGIGILGSIHRIQA
jgi:hypothetical protein